MLRYIFLWDYRFITAKGRNGIYSVSTATEKPSLYHKKDAASPPAATVRLIFSVFLITMDLHHIGYIVKNADDPTSVQESLHLVASVTDPVQEAKICLYKNSQNELIELIQPLNEKSPVWNFLQKKGEGFHHTCYSASHHEMEKYVTENQLVKLMGPMSAQIFPGQQVAFFISRDRSLIEFLLG